VQHQGLTPPSQEEEEEEDEEDEENEEDEEGEGLPGPSRGTHQCWLLAWSMPPRGMEWREQVEEEAGGRTKAARPCMLHRPTLTKGSLPALAGTALRVEV